MHPYPTPFPVTQWPARLFLRFLELAHKRSRRLPMLISDAENWHPSLCTVGKPSVTRGPAFLASVGTDGVERVIHG
jgi:hypothetical protein